MDNSTRPHYHHLKEKWTAKNKSLQARLWDKHKDSLSQLAIGSLSGLMMLSSPGISQLSPSQLSVIQEAPISKHAFLVADLSHVLPKEMRPLSEEEEKKVSDVFSRYFSFKAIAELDGKKLNRSYGLIGQEQHLARYPGDNLGSHFDSEGQAQQFASQGMAPGLGAFGYFVPSKQHLTEKDNLREKYYIAVQTFLVPDYVQRLAEYRDFFRFRKMLVVNPQNGQAVVAVIGDAGPGEFTGKHLGGSPEVMRHLERVDGSMRGPVIYFFIDDPNDTIPLGPVNL
ncbi:MAG: hypothetical protein HYV37_01540 [Candidatus Levyibacteriota bacterium]|nr:MAG: hypothetical protein HYV37_01540 [Candidatus Levybacteria bacterium]